MAITLKAWTQDKGAPSDGVHALYYTDDDATEFGSINDKISLNLPYPLAQGVMPIDVSLLLGRFDSNGTPTGTWSVILTDGTTVFELIKDAPAGRVAVGSFTHPGDTVGDEVLGMLTVTDSKLWFFEIEQTAALATATTVDRRIALAVQIQAVS